ncbi:MAG: AarF/UbiB family protein [Candidatus Bathyarchaeota archaeon]|nr:AarF/UbiB family protein [Candidatus Bathyarchaeota archaeon]
MSSAEKAAKLLTELESQDFRILQAMERGMIQHEIVPIDLVKSYSNIPERGIDYRLNKLYKKEVYWRQRDPYLGFIMNYTGYDILALNAIVKADVLEALGPSIGVGKEADVFQAVSPDETVVAVKFHRLGRTSFRDTRRKREYIADRRHISWLYQSRLAAENEYRALQLMHEVGVKVPKPIHQNRHVIVMEFIEGVQLSTIISLEEPEVFLEDILENARLTYGAGVIHTDLSEYNVLIDTEGEIWIIDWPQYISTKHKNAEETLRRDIGNVVNFFQRKHETEMTVEEALEFVKKGND